MKLFLLKLFIFIAVLSLSVLAINLQFQGKTPTADYMAAIIDKHKRLEEIDHPKLIFAGGSNLAFSINSEEIQNELSIPVVNLGLHGGLGLSFIIKELKSSIKPNDIVVFSPEYFLSNDGNYKIKQQTSSFYPNAGNYYSQNLYSAFKVYLDEIIENYKRQLSSINEIQTMQSKSGDIYSRDSFNTFGDNVGIPDTSAISELNDKVLYTYEYWTGISELNKLNEFAKKIKVKIFFIYPSYSSSAFNLNKKAIEQLNHDIVNDCKVPVLGSPSDFAFPDSLFYDTVYHLNKKGKKLRTLKIIDMLKKENIIANLP